MKNYYILMYSCGKDSTALLFKILEHKLPLDKIVYVHKDWEYKENLKILQDINKKIYPHEIEYIHINMTYWLGHHIKTRGRNKGKKGYGWPDFQIRWCSAIVRDTCNRYLKHYREKYKLYEYHGIAYNERKRAEKNKFNRNILYPLIDFKMTEKDNLKYCYSLGINFENIYKHKKRLSCWCCPMQSIADLKYMYFYKPKLWEELRRLDRLSYRKFKPEYTLKQLENKFNAEGMFSH